MNTKDEGSLTVWWWAVDALKKIGARWRMQWDFTVNPCNGTSGWFDQTNPAKPIGVMCSGCDIGNCHVINIILPDQNLTGSLPDEFSNFTSLQVM